LTRLERDVDELRAVGGTPHVAIVLGSGLGGLIDHVAKTVEVPFSEVASLPQPTVAGHRGRFVFGALGDVPVVLLDGRLHSYEGHALEEIVAPARILVRLGAAALILTNAAGATHPRLSPGDIVLIEDQINLSFRSPLAGPVRSGEERFPDMSAPFDAELQSLFLDVAAQLRVNLARGTYGGVLGPQFETAAEVRMLASLGVDVVGMSTVAEVVVARAAGVPVSALSVVSNKATGLADERLSHDDVLAVGVEAGSRMIGLVTGVVARLGEINSTEQGG
jgi:purine-nucleoside phosphorylase